MSGWVRAKVEDLSDEAPPTRTHSYQGFHGHFGFPQFCRYCGFVYLKNPIGELINRIGCAYHNDVRYRHWRRTGQVV